MPHVLDNAGYRIGRLRDPNAPSRPPAKGVAELRGAVTNIATRSKSCPDVMARTTCDVKNQMPGAVPVRVRPHPNLFARQGPDGPLDSTCQMQELASEFLCRYRAELVHEFVLTALRSAH